MELIQLLDKLYRDTLHESIVDKPDKVKILVAILHLRQLLYLREIRKLRK